MHRKRDALVRLVDVIDRLRGPGGCPWDRAQKLPDIARYLLEEVAEASDAIADSAGRPSRDVCEELGDVLMNVFLSARIAEDEGGFDLADVATAISDKLVRRHPHVFGDRIVNGVGEVLSNWDAIKAQERAEKRAPDLAAEPPGGTPAGPVSSRLDAIPRSLPTLERAHEVGRVAARVGFDWPDAEGALRKVEEELAEVRAAVGDAGALDPRDAAGQSHIVSELGDLLFAVANSCRKLGVSPETALRRTIEKFRSRLGAVERRIPDLASATLDEMEAAWQAVKVESTEESDGVPTSSIPVPGARSDGGRPSVAAVPGAYGEPADGAATRREDAP